MNEDILRSLEDYFAAQADRPLGDVELISGRALQPFSFVGQEAATNLLGKAQRALDSGDVDRARRYVEHAARLPFDDHEKVIPAAVAAHMELFSLVTDEAEQAGEHDSRWLDAALTVLADSDESARYEIRDVLVAIEHDYVLEAAEGSRIRSAVASIPHRSAARDLDLDATELVGLVMSVLAACRDYRAALATQDR